VNCRNCGTELPAGALFCGECGTTVAVPRLVEPHTRPRPGDTAIIQPIDIRAPKLEFLEPDPADLAVDQGAAAPGLADPGSEAPVAADIAPAEIAPAEIVTVAPDAPPVETSSARPTTPRKAPAPTAPTKRPSVPDPWPVTAHPETPTPVVAPVVATSTPAAAPASAPAPAVAATSASAPAPTPAQAPAPAPAPAAAAQPETPKALLTPPVTPPVTRAVAAPAASVPTTPRRLDAGFESQHDDLEATRIVRGRQGDRFVLQFSTGENATVFGTGLIGRNPVLQPGEFVDQLVTILDQGKSVSKTHLEFGQTSGVFWVVDRFSANGTVVRQPDAPPQRLDPGKRQPVARGTRVDIGEQFFVVS